jgi:hypothetical protein
MNVVALEDSCGFLEKIECPNDRQDAQDRAYRRLQRAEPRSLAARPLGQRRRHSRFQSMTLTVTGKSP